MLLGNGLKFLESDIIFYVFKAGVLRHPAIFLFIYFGWEC